MKHLIILLALIGLAGCARPYQTPKYIEVSPNETAFVIPLESSTESQVKLASEAFLNEHKVAAKRIEIPQRWNQTGRDFLLVFPGDGNYIDTVTVIKVDRTPVTRQWDSPAANGGATANKGHDTAIWVESNDSIGFSTGFSVTARIEEPDAARFLYSYVNSSLERVMDTEVRARIQADAADVSARYTMDVLRGKKQEIIDTIKADVVPFFKERGITVTTIGMFGGFTYENPKIQDAIDATFVSQQEKVNAAAQLAAQADKNAVVESAATAAAEAARKKGQGEADAKFASFKAEADGLKAVNAALAEANQNPMLVELKRIEVQKALADKWNGTMPTWVSGGGGSSPNLLFQMTPPAK